MSRIESVADMTQVYKDIRSEIPEAGSRRRLTTLYREALSVITHSFTPTWKNKYGEKLLVQLRSKAEKEFSTTARSLNKRAKEIGTEPNFDTEYGHKKGG